MCSIEGQEGLCPSNLLEINIEMNAAVLSFNAAAVEV